MEYPNGRHRLLSTDLMIGVGRKSFLRIQRVRRRRPPRVLMIEENLPLERDMRLHRQCRALAAAGFSVSVICQRARSSRPALQIGGVRIHEYPPPPEPSSKGGFIYEYFYSWVTALWLTIRTFLVEGFDALQAGNPPDTYFALALPFKLLGKQFVFDQRDLTPELYVSRYGETPPFMVAALRALEQATYFFADRVICPNESFEEVARERGHVPAEDISIVGNGPELDQLHRGPVREELKEGKDLLCCFLGAMGLQDSVDLILRAVHHLVHDQGRENIHFALMGDGESLESLKTLSRELDLTPWVTFTGWVEEDVWLDYLSTADIALEPNLQAEITTVKLMEYMALELPTVAFELKQTRLTAGDAAVYARPNDAADFARLIAELSDLPEQRIRMGRIGRSKIEECLAWRHQERVYVEMYERLLNA
jgi:glycosyltransferase involved in cell wall biosynthesis